MQDIGLMIVFWKEELSFVEITILADLFLTTLILTTKEFTNAESTSKQHQQELVILFLMSLSLLKNQEFMMKTMKKFDLSLDPSKLVRLCQ